MKNLFRTAFLIFACGMLCSVLFFFQKNAFASPAKEQKAKTLILLRHAKSSNNITSVPDFSRPLDSSGITEANEMGILLKKKIKAVDLIVASPSTRTRATAEIICSYLNYPKEKIVWDSLLYRSSTGEMLEQIRNTDEKFRTVIFVGHNPSTTQTANLLQDDLVIDEVKTCGAVAIDYKNLQWKDVGAAKGKLIFYEKPKQ